MAGKSLNRVQLIGNLGKDPEVKFTPQGTPLDQENDGSRVAFRARVSAGTYIRSIAHDLGQMLGCGGHLETLRRTEHGKFSLADSHTLESLAIVSPGNREEFFVHPRKLLPEIPSVTANDDQIALILHGRAVNLPEMSKSKYVKVFRGQREIVAIATRVAGTLFHPKIVLTQA